MCDADVCSWITTTRFNREFKWDVKHCPQGGTRIQIAEGPVLDPRLQSKYISEGTQKWTLLGSKVVPPGGPVFGPFILSDVLKFCMLLCAQNVKREATYTNSIRGRTLELFDALVANLVAMMCDADVCSC